MNKTEYERLIESRRKCGEALKAMWQAEASAQKARKKIEDQLFEIEEKLNDYKHTKD